LNRLSEIADRISQLQSEIPVFNVIAPPGIGKTTSLTREFVEDGFKFILALPNTELIGDFIGKSGCSAAWWPAISSIDLDAVPFCSRLSEIMELVEQGVSTTAICGACPLRAGCRLHAQRRNAEQASIAVVTHAALTFGMPKESELADRDALVIDETMEQAVFANPVSIKLARFAEPPVLTIGDGFTVRRACRRLHELLAPAIGRAVSHDLLAISPATSILLEHAKAEIVREMAALSRQVVRRRKSSSNLLVLKRLRDFLEAFLTLQPMLPIIRGRSSGRLSVDDTGTVVVRPVRRLAEGWHNDKVIVRMSATPEPELIGIPDGRQCIVIDIGDVARARSVTVVHVNDAPVTATKLSERHPRNRSQLLAVARFLLREHATDRSAIIATKKTLAFLEANGLGELAELVPWSQALASNAFENFTCVIVLGLPRLPPEEWAQWQSHRVGEEVPVTDREGVWALWWQKQFIIQAIGRVRPLSDKGFEQRVYCLDPFWPNNLEADEVVAWSSLVGDANAWITKNESERLLETGITRRLDAMKCLYPDREWNDWEVRKLLEAAPDHDVIQFKLEGEASWSTLHGRDSCQAAFAERMSVSGKTVVWQLGDLWTNSAMNGVEPIEYSYELASGRQGAVHKVGAEAALAVLLSDHQVIPTGARGLRASGLIASERLARTVAALMTDPPDGWRETWAVINGRAGRPGRYWTRCGDTDTAAAIASLQRCNTDKVNIVAPR
jgi:hypothetical protein